MSSTLSSCQTRDGTKIVYRLHGDPQSKKRIVLIHSLAMDHAYWTVVAERLADKAAVLTYDCRGHGASDKPAGPYSTELFADDLSDLMDHLQWPTAVVGGSSMGGSITLAFATRHAARVSALALIDTTCFYGDDAPTAWAGRAKAATEKGLGSLIEFQLTRWFGDAFKVAHPEVVDACVATFLKNDVAAYAATCNMLGNFDLRDKLASIKVPTCILVGEEDYATPIAMAEVLHRGIAGSTYDVLPKARHLTPLECPDRIVAELAALI